MNRYVRQFVLPWFGREGQERLRESSVLLVGCGGTGCVCSSFLARAGVGLIRIVDRDVVDTTDLHRQILYTEQDVGRLRLKARVAAERLKEANTEVRVEPVVAEFNPQTAESLAADADLIVDCSDNFETRMLLNEVCTKLSKSWIHGACVATAGIIIPFPVKRIACYRCIVDHIPEHPAAPTCEEAGILGPLAGAVGCIEATEAVSMLVDPESSEQNIIYIESLSHTYEAIEVRRKSDCPVCVGGTYEFLDRHRAWSGYRVCGADIVHVRLGRSVDLEEIMSRVPGTSDWEDLGDLLRIETGGNIVLLFSDGRAIIKGTSEIARARELLSKLLDW